MIIAFLVGHRRWLFENITQRTEYTPNILSSNVLENRRRGRADGRHFRRHVVRTLDPELSVVRDQTHGGI